MPSFEEQAKLIFDKLPGYTAEELERAKEAKRRREAEALGLCRFDCGYCGGVGYIRVDIGDGLMSNYKVELCPNVNPFNVGYGKRIGITEGEAANLNFEEVLLINGIGEAVEAVQITLARGFGMVYLYGSFGLGKTLILKTAVAQSLRMGRGREAAYTRMVDILDNLRAAFDEPGGNEFARLNWWADLHTLCIDEFEKVRGTEYAEERRFSLLDERYEQAIRQEGITIMASNTEPGSLPGYLSDRVQDGRFFVVELKGRSLRPGMDWGG